MTNTITSIAQTATRNDQPGRMTRDEALAKLRTVALAAGVVVKRGRIYVPGQKWYFAGTGSAKTEAEIKSMWTEFAFAIAHPGTQVRKLGLVELLDRHLADDLSWVTFGGGSYLCRPCRQQFKTVGAKMGHDDQMHPERVAERVTLTR